LHFKLDDRHDQDDEEDQPGYGGTITNFKVAETGLPEVIHHGNDGGNEWLIIAIQDIDRLENLQGADETHHQVVKNVGCQ
jgi:hypothetical protein